MGFLAGPSGEESACQCRRYRRHIFDLWVGKIPSSRISQVKEVSTFLCMWRHTRLDSLKSFFSYVSQLSWSSSLCFAHPLGLPVGSDCGLMAVRFQVFSLLSADTPAHIGGPESPMTVTSLFINTGGSISCLKGLWLPWQESRLLALLFGSDA